MKTFLVKQLCFPKDYEGYYESCDSEIDVNSSTDRAISQNWRQPLWTCLKVSFKSTVSWGVLIGLFGTFLWWLKTSYYFSDWEMIPEKIQRRRLIMDALIVSLVQF